MGFRAEIRLAHNASHSRSQPLGRLLENEHFCLDKVVKEQLEKLECFIGYSHLLPGCFGLSVSHGNVDPHTHTHSAGVCSWRWDLGPVLADGCAFVCQCVQVM